MPPGLNRYYTPSWAVDICWRIALREAWELGDKFFDPCCGGGAFSAGSHRMGAHFAEHILIDKDPTASPMLPYTVQDFLDPNYEVPDASTCITNPPFNQAGDFLLKLLESDTPVIGFLINETFLFGQARYDWIFKEHPPTCIYAFTKRISFTADGKTDSHNYVFILWDRNRVFECTEFRWISPEGHI